MFQLLHAMPFFWINLNNSFLITWGHWEQKAAKDEKEGGDIMAKATNPIFTMQKI